jgi:hypothetical protein
MMTGRGASTKSLFTAGAWAGKLCPAAAAMPLTELAPASVKRAIAICSYEEETGGRQECRTQADQMMEVTAQSGE